MMAAFGFAVPTPPEPAPATSSPSTEPQAPVSPEPEEPASGPPRRRTPRARRASRQEDSSDDPDLASGAVARIATGISAETLDLAKRAAYWNRETLRSFLEHAIEAAARRIEKEQGLALPDPSPSLRRGRPPRI